MKTALAFTFAASLSAFICATSQAADVHGGGLVNASRSLSHGSPSGGQHAGSGNHGISSGGDHRGHPGYDNRRGWGPRYSIGFGYWDGFGYPYYGYSGYWGNPWNTYSYEYPVGDYYGESSDSAPSNAVSGAILGGVAGAIIGNNSGNHNGLQGAAIGAGAGLLLGALSERPDYRRVVVVPTSAASANVYAAPAAVPATEETARPTTYVPVNANSGSSSSMSSANNLFGR